MQTKTQGEDGRCAPHRVFVHIAGYYPLSPEENYRRFRREYARSLNAWNLNGEFGPMTIHPNWASWRITTRAPDWTTEVEHILFRWEDLIEADRSRSWLERFGKSWLVFADFIANGALWNYLRYAWRYAGFFLYPFILMALLYAAAYWALKLGFGLFGTTLPSAALALMSVPLLLILLVLLGKTLKLDHLLDDWIYGRAIVRGGDPAVEARLQALANHLNGQDAEILIVGHSFGAVWGAELIRRMIEERPEGPPIRFASVGASILKIGFNSAAAPLRRAISVLANNARVIWCDYTALNDVMNFHRVDPLSALGLSGTSPRLVNVRFRPMVSAEYYRKMQRNFFRLHNQFISGNDHRAPYDYFMMMCGPFPIEALASDMGATEWIDGSGALTPAGRSRA